jgi:hypothetical protein
MKSDEQIMKEIEQAARGLLLMSEADYPFEPLHLEGTDAPSAPLLRRLAGVPTEAPVETADLGRLLRPSLLIEVRGDGTVPASAQRAEDLLRALRENLSDVTAYRVGEINIAVYVLGRSPGGGWLGVSTRVVET